MSAKLTLLDRVVNYVSPEAGLRRMAHREAMATYQGGLPTRLSTAWGTSNSYRLGSQADRRNLGNQRDRARNAYANNPIARTILKTELDNVVAEGPVLQMSTSDAAFNSECEDRYQAWQDRKDITGARKGIDFDRQVYLGYRRDGDRGVVLVDQGGESKVQLVPGDLIETPDGKYGPNMADGVECDLYGRRVRFHVKTIDEFGKREFAPVEADNFIYLAQTDEDNQVRGMTCYSQVFQYLDSLEGYVEAVTTAAQMAAIFGLVFKTANPGKSVGALPMLSGGLNGTTGESESRHAITLDRKGGMVKYVGQKDEVAQVQATQPMQQTPEFIRSQLRLIGMPFDMPLELIAKDMSTVNYASARIGLLGYYRACRVRQKWFIGEYKDREFRWWISREVKLGRFKRPVPADLRAWISDIHQPRIHRYLAIGWDYTDPVSEVQSDLLQIDMGVKTPQMCAAERGRDWEEMQVQLAAARAFRKLQELAEVRSTMTRDEPVEVPPEPPAPEPIAPDPEVVKGEALLEFKRDVVKAFLADKTVNDVFYNITDIPKLATDAGLPIDKSVQTNPDQGVPLLPVIAEAGPLVSGDGIRDPQGDIVGGDVENEAPSDSSQTPAEPGDPKQADGGGE